MSTTPLTDAIEALTRYANETTGASDTTLSDAVGTLVAGYGGGGGATIGTYSVELGQYTPTATGSFTIVTSVPTSKTEVWACVWLSDASVLTNYSSANIMTFSARPISGGMRLINYFASGTSRVEVKSVYGLTTGNRGGYRSLIYDSHANWPGQPETYNYMLVYY